MNDISLFFNSFELNKFYEENHLNSFDSQIEDLEEYVEKAEEENKKELCFINESVKENSLNKIFSVIKGHPEDKESSFFISKEPEDWYGLFQDYKGRIKLSLPEYCQTTKKIIYIFKNRKKECFLIGKAGVTFKKRMNGYLTNFNREGSENRVKSEKKQAFLKDVKEDPTNFDVGILYALKQEEDLDLFETLFIKYKKQWYDLYNDNDGGGGGLCHSEEVTSQYAIPKTNLTLFTPEKYYPYQKDEKGRIRLQKSSSFTGRIEQIGANLTETQEFAYSIKNLETGERYIGITARPSKRPTEHAYAAEYHDSTHPKFDSSRKTGALHRALGAHPDQFAFGVLPLHSIENIEENKRGDYEILSNIADVERRIIEMKDAYGSGYNCNRGGGGPIARRATNLAKRKLNFSTPKKEVPEKKPRLE